MSVAYTPSLLGGGDPEPDAALTGLRRVDLDERSWVDLVPGWLAGADTWFAGITTDAPWRQRERHLYDQTVVEPRLTCGWDVEEAPVPSGRIAALLGARYGVTFDRVAANFYRSGADSVAWHGDRVRFTHPAPVVAIVSLGSSRRFGLRPTPGTGERAGTTQWLTVAGGDLLVMGGRCQHDWQHTVPKSVRGGPRVSVTFRHSDPGPAPRRAARRSTGRASGVTHAERRRSADHP